MNSIALSRSFLFSNGIFFFGREPEHQLCTATKTCGAYEMVRFDTLTTALLSLGVTAGAPFKASKG